MALAYISAEVQNPKLVLIMGSVGFGLNVISVLFLHGKILPFQAGTYCLRY